MTAHLFSLDGRRAVVTGASRGLGRAIALGLADAGADVAVLARSQDDLDACASEITGRGRRTIAIPTDVTKSAEVVAAFDTIEREWGGLDILVNNAGTNIRQPALETSDDVWRTILQTNLDSAFFCSREAGKRMVSAGYGRVITIGSVAGVVAIPTGVAYGATKAALSHMTKSLAQEWGPHNVTVNCIAPWYFRTPLTEKLLDDPAYLARILKITPLGRTGKDEDLVGVAVFLACDASAYVTGQTLAVDGGMSTTAFHAE